jgi:hypothetical protein
LLFSSERKDSVSLEKKVSKFFLGKSNVRTSHQFYKLALAEWCNGLRTAPRSKDRGFESPRYFMYIALLVRHDALLLCDFKENEL